MSCTTLLECDSFLCYKDDKLAKKGIRETLFFIIARNIIKLKFNCIKDLNINQATLNLIEEKVGSSLECTDTGDHFLNLTPVAQALKSTFYKWNLLKQRNSCNEKIIVNKTK